MHAAKGVPSFSDMVLVKIWRSGMKPGDIVIFLLRFLALLALVVSGGLFGLLVGGGTLGAAGGFGALLGALGGFVSGLCWWIHAENRRA